MISHRVKGFQTMLLQLLLATTLICGASAFSHFRNVIPNGHSVPHPCVEGAIWEGVGHQNQGGGGDRNPFGRDFGLNGKVWNECLCKTDSDKDGLTNGEELGDPDCVWKVGETPARTNGLSHPGICEPMDSESCKQLNQWEVECIEPGFHCASLEQTEDRENTTLNISEVAIPQQVSTYMCQVVAFPQDRDYHIIGAEPALDNEELIHHIIIFGCPDHTVDDAKSKFTDPAECSMASHGCQKMLILWGVGYYGTCFNQNYGIRIGPNGFKYAILEAHYNNPDRKTGELDESGIMIHYTPTLRANDGSAFFPAPHYLGIPPHQSNVSFDGGCPEACTEHMFDGPIYITEMIPHMHLLGRSMTVEHRRNHSLVRTILQENNYNYDSPKAYLFDPPYVIEPGDEIYVRCHFDSTETDVYTYFGLRTFDEMCFPVVLYYPLQNGIRDCFVTNEVGSCGIFVGKEKSPECFEDLDAFFKGPFNDIHSDLEVSCDPAGLECKPGCQEAINKASQHPCLWEGVDHVVFDKIFNTERYNIEFVQMMASCDYSTDAQLSAFRMMHQGNEKKEGLFCELSASERCKLMPFLISLLMVVCGALTEY